MRINIINSGLIGRKIIDWTLDPATRPKTFVEFKQQMAGRLDVVDPQITKFQLVDTPADTIVIRLPEKGMIGQAKDASGNKRAIWGISIRRDSVVPLAVEFGAFDIDCGHLGVGDDNAAGVLASVEFAVHSEAGSGGGGRD